jgi:hypothetical protein
MSLNEFIRTQPCIQELAGFREQALKDGWWTSEDQQFYLLWRDRLEKGEEVPAQTKCIRSWQYRRGKKAKERRTHA